MWTIKRLVAVDQNGNRVELVGQTLVVKVCGKVYTRKLDDKEIPCLSIAITDLLNTVNKNPSQ